MAILGKELFKLSSVPAQNGIYLYLAIKLLLPGEFGFQPEYFDAETGYCFMAFNQGLKCFTRTSPERDVRTQELLVQPSQIDSYRQRRARCR